MANRLHKKKVYCKMIRQKLVPLFMVFFSVVFLAAGGARADAFTVDVPVDVTAQNAAAAREQAHQQARRDAFARLLRRLVLAEDNDKVAALEMDNIDALVQSLEVDNEKTSGVRYIADLSVHFKPRAVRQLMESNALRYAETVSKPVVVVPLLEQQGGKTLLWEKENIWRQVWQRRASRNGLVPLVVAKDSALSERDGNAVRELLRDEDQVSGLVVRSNASALLLATAEMVKDAPAVRVSAVMNDGKGKKMASTKTFTGTAGDTPDMLMLMAVHELQDALEQRWKTENVIDANEAGTLLVDVPFATLKEWQQLEKSIRSVGIVRGVVLEEFSKNNARVTLQYSGTLNNLTSALQQMSLTLERRNEGWVLGR